MNSDKPANDSSKNITVKKRDAVIIGGGPAGLAAAIRLFELGIKDILILEREENLGGILRQCIHDGFGLTRFKETLSGPEYAQRFIEKVEKLGIEYITGATVFEITDKKRIFAAARGCLIDIQARAIVLAMGCRERTRGAVSIPGSRPAGIYTAGVAQSYINLKNHMVGKKAVILGSGDIGMIMARRLTLEGMKVLGVYEIAPVASGLPRNIEQCLRDYDIPLYLSHSVTEIRGEDRLESVVVSQVDDKYNPVPGSEKEIKCDTLILSVGLIPENELTWMIGAAGNPDTKGACVDERYQTSVAGVFAAGNVLHVHDLADFVSEEAEKMAEGAAEYLRKGSLEKSKLRIIPDKNIMAVVPSYFGGYNDVNISFRVRKPVRDCKVEILQGDVLLKSKKFAKLLPAEMVQIYIEDSLLAKDRDIEVRVI